MRLQSCGKERDKHASAGVVGVHFYVFWQLFAFYPLLNYNVQCMYTYSRKATELSQDSHDQEATECRKKPR